MCYQYHGASRATYTNLHPGIALYPDSKLHFAAPWRRCVNTGMETIRQGFKCYIKLPVHRNVMCVRLE